MDHRAYFALLADYNAWANRRLVAGLAPLDDAAWHADQGLFFKSIHATFNSRWTTRCSDCGHRWREQA